jgi:hypothetical protein
MDVIFLKTGDFALHPVYGPVVKCKIGASQRFEKDSDASMLIEYGWAEEVAEKKSVRAENVSEEDTPPWKHPDWHPRAEGVKDSIQAYADKLGLGIDLDLRKSVRKLITTVETARNGSR